MPPAPGDGKARKRHLYYFLQSLGNSEDPAPTTELEGTVSINLTTSGSPWGVHMEKVTWGGGSRQSLD